MGEWATGSIAIGRGNQIEMLKELRFPHSLGLLYSAFTYFTGFKVNSGEYKLMGLAPYGEPRYRDTILDNLIDSFSAEDLQQQIEPMLEPVIKCKRSVGSRKKIGKFEKP